MIGNVQALDIIVDKGFARAAALPATWPPPGTSPQRGEAGGGKPRRASRLEVSCPSYAPLPTSPQRGEASAGGGVGNRLCSNAHDVAFLLTIMSSTLSPLNLWVEALESHTMPAFLTHKIKHDVVLVYR